MNSTSSIKTVQFMLPFVVTVVDESSINKINKRCSLLDLLEEQFRIDRAIQCK